MLKPTNGPNWTGRKSKRLLVLAALAIAAPGLTSEAQAATMPAPLQAYVSVAQPQFADEANLLVAGLSSSETTFFPDLANRSSALTLRKQLLALARKLDTTGVGIVRTSVNLRNCIATPSSLTVELTCDKLTDIEFGPLDQGQSVSTYIVPVRMGFSVDLLPRLTSIQIEPGDIAQRLPTDDFTVNATSSTVGRKVIATSLAITTPSTFVGMTASQKLLAVSYALQYAAVYNYDYPSYPKDCANFISQALRAGGWRFVGDGSYLQMKDSNYWNFFTDVYPVPSYIPYSWRVAHSQYEFAVGSSHRGLPLTTQTKAGAIANQTQLFPGDLVYYSADTGDVKTMDHVVIVTNRGDGIVKISSHNEDRLNMKFTTWAELAQENAGSPVYFYFVRT